VRHQFSLASEASRLLQAVMVIEDCERHSTLALLTVAYTM
jgi:hypothetical protein